MRIQTLGGLKAFIGDEPLSLPPSRQSRALLAYLACSGKPLHRAGLCDLLWENTPEPRAALRWCLSRLRPVLDAGGVARLVTESDTLFLPPETCEVDGKRLRQLAVAAVEASTPELEEAVTRLAGAFLADLEFADAMRFESWRVAEEKSLGQARAALFGELLRRHKADPEAAVRVGHLWVQQDPFDPRPHVAIIEALAALGRKREALAHYERCAQTLRHHGGGVPEALEKARAGLGRLGPGTVEASVLPKAGPVRAASAAPERTPLAGRGREMAAFARLLEDSRTRPDGRLRLLTGEPGIGKTRLLEEMASRLWEEGYVLLRGRAFEAERGRAFGPWIDAAWALSAARPDIAAGCPLLHPSSLAGSGPGDASALFEAVRAWLSPLADQAPLALILDDIHWLDASSVALLQYLSRGAGGPFRVLLAGMRSVAAPRDAAVEAFLRLVRREGWVEGWDIGPLSAEDTADLLKKLGSRRNPAEVFALGAGHPLACLALAQEGPDASRRESLEAMLDERVRLAGDEGRGILQWASLMGRGLPPALLESLTDLSVHALLAALERLEAQGLVKVEAGKAGMEYLFGHDLIRQRVKEGLSGPRNMRMHAHVAEVLRRKPALSRGAEEVAHHAELAGEKRLAAESYLQAGHQCARLKAYEAATGHAKRSLELAIDVEGTWVLRQEACFLINVITNSLARFPEGLDALLLRLSQEAKAAGQQETLVAALTALTTLRYEQGRPSDVADAVEEVIGSMGEEVEPNLRAFTLADMSLCLLVTDQDLPKARRLMEASDKVMQAFGLQVGFTDMARAVILIRDGRYAEGRAAMERSLPALSTTLFPGLQHYALRDLALLDIEQGRPAEAREAAARMRALEPEVRHKADVHFADAIDALALRLQGDPGAEALYRDVLERLRGRDVKVMTASLLLFWSEGDLDQGRTGEVISNCREAIERCEPLGRITEPSWARVILGRLALAEGRRDEAERYWADIEAALRRDTPPPAHVRRRADAFRAALFA